MTKTLTEQWREGTLEEGFYYILFASRFGEDYIAIDMFISEEKDFMYSSCEDVKEVLAPVPSYDEIKRLQEQLKDAREVIKLYAETTVGHKQKDGTYRLSVATGTINFLDPFFGIKSEMQEYVYDPRPAKKWLKKWKV